MVPVLARYHLCTWVTLVGLMSFYLATAGLYLWATDHGRYLVAGALRGR